MTQSDKILEFMRTHGSITTYQGFTALRVTKVSTRISEMIRAGVHISKERVTDINEDGDPVHYTRYFLNE